MVIDEVDRVAAGSVASIPAANARCSPSGSGPSASADSLGRSVASSGTIASPTAAPASARRRCLVPSRVPVPNAKLIVAVLSTARSS